MSRRGEPRCRLLDALGRRCPDPGLGSTGLCTRHLAQAVRDFYRLTEGQTITIRPEPRVVAGGRPST